MVREKIIKESRIWIHLFGKPAWEIKGLEGEELDEKFAEKLRETGERIKEWLDKVAEIHKKLVKAGWKAYGTLYDIDYCKEIPKSKAKKELKKLGLGDLEVEEEEYYEEA